MANDNDLSPRLKTITYFIKTIGIEGALLILLVLVISGIMPSPYLGVPIARIETIQVEILADTAELKIMNARAQQQLEAMTKLLGELVKLNRAICNSLPDNQRRVDCTQ